MDERCPTCGAPVEVVSGDEGTSHYRPVVADLESAEALNVAAAAFENAAGTTHGVGDGMRAALAALAAWRRNEPS